MHQVTSLLLAMGCPPWTQAEDSSGRHASQIQEHQEAAAAAKKAAVAAQAELKKVCFLPTHVVVVPAYTWKVLSIAFGHRICGHGLS